VVLVRRRDFYGKEVAFFRLTPYFLPLSTGWLSQGSLNLGFRPQVVDISGENPHGAHPSLDLFRPTPVSLN
jgi:hypothetical protein